MASCRADVASPSYTMQPTIRPSSLRNRSMCPASCLLLRSYKPAVEGFIIFGRKVENGPEHQESRSAPAGRGIVEVDRREHDNRGHNRPSRAVGSRSSETG